VSLKNLQHLLNFYFKAKRSLRGFSSIFNERILPRKYDSVPKLPHHPSPDIPCWYLHNLPDDCMKGSISIVSLTFKYCTALAKSRPIIVLFDPILGF
jgi:hypothetical protein